jgi:cytidylate kinase
MVQPFLPQRLNQIISPIVHPEKANKKRYENLYGIELKNWYG